MKDSRTPSARPSSPGPLPGQTSFLESAGADPAPPPAPVVEAPPDPFDPGKYALGTNYASMIGTQEHLLSVPIRKPSREAFFRVHPTNRLETAVVEVGDDTGDPETFLVDPTLWPSLVAEPMFGPALLVHYQTRQGVNAVWRIKLPRPGDKLNPWTASALQAVKAAEIAWTRLKSDRALGAYVAETATGITEAPRWPDYPFSKLLEIAFRDRIIASLDHPILKRLRGEV